MADLSSDVKPNRQTLINQIDVRIFNRSSRKYLHLNRSMNELKHVLIIEV